MDGLLLKISQPVYFASSLSLSSDGEFLVTGLVRAFKLLFQNLYKISFASVFLPPLKS